MEKTLLLALSQCEAAEIYRVTSASTPVQFENNQLKSIDTSETSGMALRVIKNGRIGFSSSTRPGDTDELVRNAVATAEFGPEAGFAFPGAAALPKVENCDANTMAVPVEDMVRMGEDIVDVLRTEEAASIASVSVEKGWVLRELMNSSGLNVAHRSSSLTLFASSEIVLGENFLSVCDWAGGVSPALDTSGLKQRLVEKVRTGRRNVSLQSGKYPVIITPLALDDVLRPLVASVNGRAVEKGFSPLKDRLGQKVADSKFSLYDDPVVQGSIVARPFDSEGVASRRLPLIEKGVLNSFQVDLKTAAVLGTAPTGSAVRHGLDNPPNISPSCLTVEPGKRPVAEIIRSMERGVIVDLLMGAWSGNAFGGVVSGNIMLGFVVENGEITGRLKNAMFSVNAFDAFEKDLLEISSDKLDYGSALFPYILLDNASIVVKAD